MTAHATVSAAHCTRRFAGIARIVLILTGLLMAAPASGASEVSDVTRQSVDVSSLANTGYPELHVVVTDDGFTAPERAIAGMTLVVLENRGTEGGAAAVTDVNLLQLPAGVALQEFNDGIVTNSETPPDWLADIVATGGFKAAAGETRYGVLMLTAGEWIIGAGDANPFVPLLVTGDVSDVPPPRADIEIEITEFVLPFPEQTNAGVSMWHVWNEGDQSHEVMLVKTPILLNAEQVIELLTLPEGESPSASVPDPSELEFPPAGVQTLSPEKELWVEMSLEPGFYVALCANPEEESGVPHAALGEIAIFTVVD